MNLTDLFPNVMPHLPGCPKPLVLHHLRESWARFCRDTHAWQKQLPPVFLVPSVEHYRLYPPDDTVVIHVPSVRFHREHLHGELEGEYLIIRDNQREGEATVSVVLQPVVGTDAVESVLLARYGRGIAYGALQALCELPRQEWSNPDAVPLYERYYREAVAEARISVQQSGVGTSRRVQQRPFL